jgi:hypothetical protein
MTRLARFAAVVACIATPAVAQYSTPMKNVDNPDRFPYQESNYFTIDMPYKNAFGYFPTPSGKRYVIEHVNLSCSTPSATDTFPQVYLTVSKNVTNGTIGTAVPLAPPQKTGTAAFGGYAFFSASSVKVYADPSPYDANGGSAIYLNVFHTDTSVKPGCSAVITGHSVTP